jgi:GNAT superfamily N-acetyltransferase
METADRLIRLSTIAFELVDPASDAANEAMAAYFAELDVRFTDGFDVDAPSAGHELDRMRSPIGGFVVIDDNGVTCGCGGLQRIDLPHIGVAVSEIKRMWLAPSLRGLGLGKRLLGRLEQLAADLGHDHVVLDTNAALTEAIAMYGAAGYETIERYNDNPYAQHWFIKTL